MICPNCGFEQPDGLMSCANCGVVFSHGPPVGAEPIHDGLLPSLDPPAPTNPLPYAGPVPPEAQTRRFGTGDILREAFQIYFANFLPFVILTALPLSPVLLFYFFTRVVFVKPQTAHPTLPGRAFLMGLFLHLFCDALVSAAISFGVLQQMRDRSATVADCLRKGISNMLPVFGVAFTQTLVFLVGLMLCIVPGFLFSSTYAVAVPVAVEERPGIFAAMKRSGQLTSGHRDVTCSIFMLAFLLAVGQGLAIRAVNRALWGGSPAVGELLRDGSLLVSTGFWATATAIQYYRLRSVKESIDVEQIASVFD